MHTKRSSLSRITGFQPVLALIAVLAAGAAPAPEPSDPADVLAPFLDEQVVAVVRVDASRVDLKALETWLVKHLRAGQPDGNAAHAEAMKEIAGELQKIREPMEQGLAQFLAAGGREAYVILSPTELAANTGPAAIIPLGKGADPDKLMALIGAAPGAAPPEMAERAGDVILFGTPAVRAKLRGATREQKANKTSPANAELIAALAGAEPDVAVQVAIAPSADARRAFAQLAPTLPPQLGGGPTEDLARGLRWAAVGIKLAPTPSVHAVVQAEDAKAAESIEGVLRKAMTAAVESLNAMAAQPQNKGEAPMFTSLARLLTALAPAREGDRLVLAVDDRGLAEVARVSGAGLAQARRSAQQVQSMTNIRQLLLASHMWAADHKGDWPDDLPAAMKAAKLPAQLAVNPRAPKTGYTYVKPSKETKDPSTRIAIYEETPDVDGRAVGYMDGHAEWVKEEEFQRQLKAQQ